MLRAGAFLRDWVGTPEQHVARVGVGALDLRSLNQLHRALGGYTNRLVGVDGALSPFPRGLHIHWVGQDMPAKRLLAGPRRAGHADLPGRVVHEEGQGNPPRASGAGPPVPRTGSLQRP